MKPAEAARPPAGPTNTTTGAREVKDSYSLRRQTLLANIPYFTTIAAALAACDAVEAQRGDSTVRVKALQEWNAETVGDG